MTVYRTFPVLSNNMAFIERSFPKSFIRPNRSFEIDQYNNFRKINRCGHLCQQRVYMDYFILDNHGLTIDISLSPSLSNSLI